MNSKETGNDKNDLLEIIQDRSNGRDAKRDSSSDRTRDADAKVAYENDVDLLEIVRFRARCNGTQHAVLKEGVGAYQSGQGDAVLSKTTTTSTTTFDDGNAGDNKAPPPPKPLARQDANCNTPPVLPGAYAASTTSGSNSSPDLLIVDTESEARPSTDVESAFQSTLLSVATPIESDDMSVCSHGATPVDIHAAQIRKAVEQKKTKRVLLALAALLLGVVVAVVIGFTQSQRGKHATTATESSPAFPSMAPSQAPTAMDPMDVFLGKLPAGTQEQIAQSHITPQWKAFHWLSNHPDVSSLPGWRRVQLFALAVFFFALEGPHWPQHIQDNWMFYTPLGFGSDLPDECYWYSSTFGYYAWDDQFIQTEYASQHANNNTICNEDGEVQILYLSHLELDRPGLKPFLPPEIALLTSLLWVSQIANGIHAPLTEFLPNELYQMSSIEMIWLEVNTLTGPLPSELFLMTNLVELDLGLNALTGPLPTQIGLLTRLTSIGQFGDNFFTGTMPTQLALLTELGELRVANNLLSGALPSQLAALTKLTWLNLPFNRLTGAVPTQIGLLTSLERLELESNNFWGPIPSQIGMLPLQQMSLQDNTIEFLPTELGLLSDLTKFEVSNMALPGSIPHEIVDLALHGKLSWLQLDENNNEFTGVDRLPEGLCTLGNSVVSACQKIAPISCPSGSTLFQLALFTDNYASETTWEVVNECTGETVASGGPYEDEVSAFYFEQACLPEGPAYRFAMADAYADGICCLYGKGGYLVLHDLATVGSGAVFEETQTTHFGGSCTPDTPVEQNKTTFVIIAPP